MDVPKTGQVRVGTMTFAPKRVPSFPGFTPIIVMTKTYGRWWPLSPYALKTKEGWIMENVWQFSKVYEKVPAVQIKQHPQAAVSWEWPAETHVDEAGNILPAYWAWREAGFCHHTWVRYPVGKDYAKNCMYAMPNTSLPQSFPSSSPQPASGGESGVVRLNYVESRKAIYGAVYIELVKQHPMFKDLQDMLERGENLLIIEVDGPHEESLGYYQQTYGVADDFIEDNTMLATEANLHIMLNDTKHPFGHGYCLAAALQNIELK